MKVSQSSEKSREVPSAEKFPGVGKNEPKTTSQFDPSLDHHGASLSEPRMETEASGISIRGVQITIWVPSGNFTEATEAQMETADPYGTPGSALWNRPKMA